MVDWQFTEIIITLRDYHTLLDQIAIVLITSAALLTYKISQAEVSKCPIILSFITFTLGIISLFMGFGFRSKLIDIILGLKYDENPTSLTDPTLKHITFLQIIILIIGAIILIISGLITSKKEKTIVQ